VFHRRGRNGYGPCWELGTVAAGVESIFGTVTFFRDANQQREKTFLIDPFFNLTNSFIFFLLLFLFLTSFYAIDLSFSYGRSFLISCLYHLSHSTTIRFQTQTSKNKTIPPPLLLSLLPSAKNATAFPSHKTVLLHPCPQRFSHTPTQAQFLLPFSSSSFRLFSSSSFKTLPLPLQETNQIENNM